MTGSATLTAVPSMKLIAEPRIAAIRTHVFPIGDGMGYDPRTPLLDEGGSIPVPSAKTAAKKAPKRKKTARRKPSAKRKAPPIKVPARPTPPERIPPVISDPTLAEHLAIITRAVFQAGLSWTMLDAKWPLFETAFEGSRRPRSPRTASPTSTASWPCPA